MNVYLVNLLVKPVTLKQSVSRAPIYFIYIILNVYQFVPLATTKMLPEFVDSAFLLAWIVILIQLTVILVLQAIFSIRQIKNVSQIALLKIH